MELKKFIYGVFLFLFLLTIGISFINNTAINSGNPIPPEFNFSFSSDYTKNLESNSEYAQEFLNGSAESETEARSTSFRYVQDTKENLNLLENIGMKISYLFGIPPALIYFLFFIITIGFIFAMVKLISLLFGGGTS